MVSKFEKDVYERFNKTDARLDNLEKDMKDMKKDMTLMKQDMSNMKKDINFMKEDLLTLQHSLETMQQSIFLIEHQVTTVIPALLDGYSMHQQKQEIQQENLTSLNVKVAEHDIRISSLEQAIV